MIGVMHFYFKHVLVKIKSVLQGKYTNNEEERTRLLSRTLFLLLIP